MNAEERQGVKMVIALQAFVGITQPADEALAGWRQLSKEQKKITRQVYERLKSGNLKFTPSN